MTNIRHQQHYRAMYIPKKTSNSNPFLGVAFEIEKPVHNLIRSFYSVWISPVDINERRVR